MTMTADDRQVLALAAIFQAAIGADRLATTGQCDSNALATLTESILALDRHTPESVFPDPGTLHDGLSLLLELLQQGQPPGSRRALSHALALMHLANRVRKAPDLSAILRHRLEALQAQRPHFDDPCADDFCQRLAGIYQDTLGTLSFRIRVPGEPMHLRNENTAARIRALFLAGVRAAFLWRQAGGRRWHLLFRRKPLLNAARRLEESIKNSTLH